MPRFYLGYVVLCKDEPLNAYYFSEYEDAKKKVGDDKDCDIRILLEPDDESLLEDEQ